MSQPEQPQQPVRGCKTCFHRQRSVGGDRCGRGGYLCSTERKYANMSGSQCDVNFSGWVQRPKPWWKKMLGL